MDEKVTTDGLQKIGLYGVFCEKHGFMGIDYFETLPIRDCYYCRECIEEILTKYKIDSKTITLKMAKYP